MSRLKKIKKHNLLTLILGLYLFFVPLDFLTGRYLGGTGLSTLISFVIIILGVIQILFRNKVYLPFHIVLLILLATVGSIPLIWNDYFPIGRIATYAYYIILVVTFTNLVYGNKVDSKLIIKFAFWGILAMSFYLLRYGTLGYGGTRLATLDRSLNPNVASGFILLGMGVVNLLIHNKKSLYIYGSITGVLLITLLLLQSKTAFLSLFISVFVIGLIIGISSVKRRKGLTKYGARRFILLVTSIGLIILVAFQWILPTFNIQFSEINRLLTVFSGNRESITTGRSIIWEHAFSNMNVTGVGFLAFRDAFHRAPHSLYISTLTESGVIGVFIILMFIITLYKKVLRLKETNLKLFLQCIFILTYNFIFGFGNDVMEYKFFWASLLIVEIILIKHEDIRPIDKQTA